MSENVTYNVKNRSAGMVVYTIPEIGARREFAPGETKKITFEELEKLTFVPGGRYLLAEFLQVGDVVNEAFNIQTQPEYYLTDEQIIELIQTGSHDEWLDALDFAPVGVMDLIKKYSISVPLTDTVKIASLKKKTGFDVVAALANERADKEVEPAFKETTLTRRTKPKTDAPQGRRTEGSKYKVISKEEN